MRRVASIGSPGSGKTYFAKRLAGLLRVPLYHLDDLYWHADWVATPEPEWEREIHRLVGLRDWVIDGNYASTLDVRLRAADTVIFLDTPYRKCLHRALWRTMQNLWSDEHLPARIREARLERPQAASEGVAAFVQRIRHFHRDTRPVLLDKMRRLTADGGGQVIILRSKEEAGQLLASFARGVQVSF